MLTPLFMPVIATPPLHLPMSLQTYPKSLDTDTNTNSVPCKEEKDPNK
uniref:Uncharacterized protein n=1 Tax=Arundo donax TaxID=35708 RepID=A0A0A8YZW9_ARUDO